MVELQPRSFAGRIVRIYENEHIRFGFTEIDFSAADLQRFFAPRPLLFLKQVHQKTILKDSDWRPAIEADGLLLQKTGNVAVIQTADCIPLFYYDDDFSLGGIIHVGWSGLFQGIELELLAMLPGDLDRYQFFLGPAIEKKCYPVGEELVELFNAKPYAKNIFTPRPDGKFLMDIKAAMVLSLRHAGVAAGRIQDSGLCTFCHPDRFPSYRRDGKTGKRIFNFLSLR